MIVFISWSGARSRFIAETLRTWLKDVMQVLEPWVSTEDIRQGARWNLEVARKLEEAKFGIICLTRENLSEPWILFEAGALAKTLDKSLVCPYLFDLKPTELKGPLIQFQAARAIESDTRKLVHSLNKALGENILPHEQVDRAFTKWWPDLENTLRITPESRAPLAELRSDRELLEEILDRVRQTSTDVYSSSRRWEERLSELKGSNIFEGPDVSNLMKKIDTLGSLNDPNDSIWFHEHSQEFTDELNGFWSTRWNGGIARDQWITGIGHLQVYGQYLYVITHDELSKVNCLIAARRLDGDRLAGRYINLYVPREVPPWVGRIINKDRIDGLWLQGRWDLRR